MKVHAHKNILILGGGFGGVNCALKLEGLLKNLPEKIRHPWEIVVVDKNDYHLYTPPLYEVATASSGDIKALNLKKLVTLSLEEIFKNKKVKLDKGRVETIELNRKKVIFADRREMPFEYLAITLGAETNFFNIPGLKEQALPIKTLEDAVIIRNRIKKIIAENRSFKVVVGGAGSTGVEFIGELAHWLKKQKRRRKIPNYELILIEGAPTVLPGFEQDIVLKVTRRLQNLGVKIITSSLIQEASPNQIKYKKEDKIFTLPYDLLIWAGGIKAVKPLEKLQIAKGKGGRLVCPTPSLEVAPNVYVLGDAAFLCYPGTETAVPATASIAAKEALIVASNICASIYGQPKKKFIPTLSVPYIIPVGGKWAVAKIGKIKLFGFKAWFLKQLVELWHYCQLINNFKAFGLWLKGLILFSRND